MKIIIPPINCFYMLFNSFLKPNCGNSARRMRVRALTEICD